MSKFRSKCGYLMVMRTGEEPYEHQLLQDKTWIDKFGSFVEELPEVIHRKEHENDAFDSLYTLMLDNSSSVLKCPQCGRIYIEFEGTNEYVVFKPETWEE